MLQRKRSLPPAVRRVLVLPPPQQVPPLSELLALVEQHRLTALSLPVSYFREWVRVLHQHPVPTCIRLIITGAETVLAPRLAAWFGTSSSKTDPRRSSTMPTAWVKRRSRTRSTVPKRRFLRELSRCRLAPADCEHPNLYPGPRWQSHRSALPGELYVGGECLALLILNKPALTRERIIHRMPPWRSLGLAERCWHWR